MISRRVRRGAIGCGFGLLLAILPASTVAADPAGPTDYRSEVAEITPLTPQITARIVGGDSFLLVEVAPGSEAFIKGYSSELYLWIDSTGEVWQNRKSPATYYNTERFGAEIPAFADPAANPEWERIGSGHAWAWHDHRVHRMEPFAPLNSEPGDQILDAVVPVIVNGVPVEIRVVSIWAPAPSPIPTIVGALIGLGLLGWWWRTRRSGALTTRRSVRLAAALTAPIGVAALAIGVWQFVSLPAATGPLWTWWVLPLVAVLAATSAFFSSVGSLGSAGAALAISGTQLLLWGWERRTGLWRAILPTEAPWWLDRAVTAAVIPVAIGGLGLGLWVLAAGVTPARWQSRS
jgi:hypothetical protein